ncbi:oligoribonuclease [Catenovulum maritimum]|uniref:Oligoribonuclease n=1 Tax=Catenovulum maritimum TaxID=1513271 RepID=A0A0J8JI10_9ALTE|nr:oligoribonuclease [Catenovulum maritimum]KMT64071.1 oligoribonuclease [Catenovulum maritimum]
MSFSEKNLIWLDLEMTGLEPATDKILEIATIVTDSELNILAEGPVFAIHQPDDVLDNMDEWCVNQHGKSGLTQRCKDSKIDLKTASDKTIEFLSKYVPPGKSPMCGNSISQDRRFMYLHMVELEAYFHYRNLDVSTIKELARRWRPELVTDYKKKGVHLALEDIHESIEELARYKESFFKL